MDVLFNKQLDPLIQLSINNFVTYTQNAFNKTNFNRLASAISVRDRLLVPFISVSD